MRHEEKIKLPLSESDRARCDVVLEENCFDLTITDTMRLPVLRMLREQDKERQHGSKTRST
jgi:hypothetical protein